LLAVDRATVDRDDLVTGAKARIGGGRPLLDVAHRKTVLSLLLIELEAQPLAEAGAAALVALVTRLIAAAIGLAVAVGRAIARLAALRAVAVLGAIGRILLGTTLIAVLIGAVLIGA